MSLKNKFLASLFLVSTLSISTWALDFQDDKVGVKEVRVLSSEEIQAEKTKFYEMITRYKSNFFVGFAQYAMSSLQLSQKVHINYYPMQDQVVRFQMSTAGNKHLMMGDVAYPMQAKVYFEIKDTNGNIVSLNANNGEEVNFLAQKNRLYLLETRESFDVRKNIQSPKLKDSRITGRFMAVVDYDLFEQHIEFYELDEASNILVKKGNFQGNVAPTRTGF